MRSTTLRLDRAPGVIFPINAEDCRRPRTLAPSMRQKIDIADLYAKALHALLETMDGQPPLPDDP
jgi:hypothetical protein